MKDIIRGRSILWLAIVCLPAMAVAQKKKTVQKAATVDEQMAPAVKETQQLFTGVVKSSTGLPLPGVLVNILEGKRSTLTDKAGRFSIPSSAGNVLLFSLKGYHSVQQEITAGATYTIEMRQALTDGGDEDEVVIPFGVRKKRELTAAISSYQAKNLPSVMVSDFRNLLSGRISGLYVAQTATTPGNNSADFRVRGRTSSNAADALVLVDGVQRDYTNMDKDEIESISVLKDAAAVAWYGLSGANGVVLITTKKGRPANAGIHVDISTSIQTPQHLTKPLNSYDFASLYNEAAMNDGLPPLYNAAALDAYQSGKDLLLYPNNNYVDEYFKKASLAQRVILSASGGSASVRYFTLLGYLGQGGLFNNTETADYNSNASYRRFNFRSNVDFNVTSSLSVSLNAGGRVENRLSPGNGTSVVLNSIYNTPPNAFPLVNADGSYGGTSIYRQNPLAELQSTGYNNATNRVLLASLNAEQKLDELTKGLSFNVLFSDDVNGIYTSGLNKDYAVYDFTGTAPVSTGNAVPLSYRAASFSGNQRRNELWAGFDYDRQFSGDHSLKVSLRGKRFTDAAPERLDFRSQGISFRTDYSFRNKYYVDFVGAYDGSENFPPGARYGFFPAVSAGWIVSEEKFLPAGRILSYLKLRGSYGTSGNSNIGGSRFPFETFYGRNTTAGGYIFGTGFTATNSANEINLGNPEVTWESLRTTNVGVDFKLFRNALSLSVDGYKNTRYNILTTAVLPSILGQSIGAVNKGIVESRGIDLDLNYTKDIGKLTVVFNGNLSWFDNKVIAQNGQEGVTSAQSTIGRRAGSMLIYLSDGLFQSAADIAASPTQNGATLMPGDIRYKDVSGPAGIPDGKVDAFDRVRVNSGDLNTFYGFGSNLHYNSIDFSFQFQGVLGRTLYLQDQVYNNGPFNLSRESLNRWTPATAATATYPRLGLSNRSNNILPSDFWARSGNYLRLKSVEIGYTFPTQWLSKYGLQATRFYVGGFNVATFSRLHFDLDPELPTAGQGTNSPYLQTFTVGISTQF